MNSHALLFQALDGGTFGLIAGFIFFLMFAGVAYVAFRILKKSAKMAVRMLVVALILAIAVAGSVSLWYFSLGAVPKLKPPANRKR
jgi:hypothetical protein